MTTEADLAALERKIANAKASLTHYQDKARDNKIQSEHILDQAKAKAEQCMAAAHKVAKEVHDEIAAERARHAQLADSKCREAETTLFEARAEAKRIVAEANGAVNGLRHEAQQLDAAKAALISERDSLAAEVARLQGRKSELDHMLAAIRQKVL